ncbi:MAG: trimethylamine methyltransferase family protein, partial [Actinobacteria bacterium]|nr:trimethylamine methyltransferase family protein [Actinomycetota bacterium]
MTVLDMAATTIAYGAPELSRMSAAFADLARFLRLPVFSTAGCSDAKAFDEQGAAEAAFSLLAAGLSGAHLIHDVGYLEGGLAGSLELLVAADELIGMARRILRGIEVTPVTLAASVVADVGPGGHYLDWDHTVTQFRRELWFPRLMDRTRFDSWRAAGATTLADRARQRALELLRDYAREPLEAGVLRELQAI